MPINLTLGNSAKFIVEYLSSSGALTTPPTATMDVSYYQGGVAFTDTLTLTAEGSFFTGTWNSSAVDLGPVDWAANAPGVATPAATGQIRIVAER